MEKNHFLHILKKYLSNKATPLEERYVDSYYDLFQAKPGLTDKLTPSEIRRLGEQIKTDLDHQITEHEITPQYSIPDRAARPIYRRFPRLAAAAVLLVIISGALFLVFSNHRQSQPIVVHDASPGGNKAILYLANGNKIILNSLTTGSVIQQAGAQIRKTGDGQISYNTSLAQTPAADTYNRIETPRGGQYTLVLPDNSTVYLNASSSLRFPTAFSGAGRKVELTGEAYFEIAPDRARPFLVTTQGQTVEVLGTHFNINAYNDEDAIKTTLLEGRIRVSAGQYQSLLAPNDQASVRYTEEHVPVLKIEKNSDTEEAIAWKNGMFYFENADIHSIMRQYARWYDVDVVYSGTLPNRQFSGEIRRDINASQALEILKDANIHFHIEGRKITITP